MRRWPRVPRWMKRPLLGLRTTLGSMPPVQQCASVCRRRGWTQVKRQYDERRTRAGQRQ
jgi:hypothetical protein